MEFSWKICHEATSYQIYVDQLPPLGILVPILATRGHHNSRKCEKWVKIILGKSFMTNTIVFSKTFFFGCKASIFGI